MEKCSACGAPLHDGTCPYCGATSRTAVASASGAVTASPEQAPATPQPQVVINQTSTQNPTCSVPLKRKWTAFVLCLLLGYLGAHYFYAGKPVMGVVYVLTLGLFGVGWIIDIVRILLGAFHDGYGRALEA